MNQIFVHWRCIFLNCLLNSKYIFIFKKPFLIIFMCLECLINCISVEDSKRIQSLQKSACAKIAGEIVSYWKTRSWTCDATRIGFWCEKYVSWILSFRRELCWRNGKLHHRVLNSVSCKIQPFFWEELNIWNSCNSFQNLSE